MALVLRGLGKGLLDGKLWSLSYHVKVQMNYLGVDMRRDGLLERVSFFEDMGSPQVRVMKFEMKDQSHVEDYYPIFIRALSRKSVCIQIQNTNSIQEVKSLFQTKERMALEEAYLYLEGNTPKDTDLIFKYNIGWNLTLFLSLRLRGGVVGKGATSSSKPSFREAVDNRSIPV